MSAHLFCRPICQLPHPSPYLLLLGLSCSCNDVAFSTKKSSSNTAFFSAFPFSIFYGWPPSTYCFSPPSSSSAAAAVIIMFYRRLDRYGKVNATRNGKKAHHGDGDLQFGLSQVRYVIRRRTWFFCLYGGSMVLFLLLHV